MTPSAPVATNVNTNTGSTQQSVPVQAQTRSVESPKASVVPETNFNYNRSGGGNTAPNQSNTSNQRKVSNAGYTEPTNGQNNTNNNPYYNPEVTVINSVVNTEDNKLRAEFNAYKEKNNHNVGELNKGINSVQSQVFETNDRMREMPKIGNTIINKTNVTELKVNMNGMGNKYLKSDSLQRDLRNGYAGNNPEANVNIFDSENPGSIDPNQEIDENNKNK